MENHLVQESNVGGDLFRTFEFLVAFFFGYQQLFEDFSRETNFLRLSLVEKESFGPVLGVFRVFQLELWGLTLVELRHYLRFLLREGKSVLSCGGRLGMFEENANLSLILGKPDSFWAFSPIFWFRSIRNKVFVENFLAETIITSRELSFSGIINKNRG